MKLRSTGITDTAVLSAMERVSREVFVSDALKDKAYEDMALPIARGQTISQPSVVAAMTEALHLHDRHKVLEIGTGSGYQTAILARICRRVYSIERHDILYQDANQLMCDLMIHNVTLKCGDGMKGWTEQAPFDRIIVTAAAFSHPPEELVSQLSIGGILIIPIGLKTSDQYLVRYTKQEDGTLSSEHLFPVRFVPLLPNVSKCEQMSYSSECVSIT